MLKTLLTSLLAAAVMLSSSCGHETQRPKAVSDAEARAFGTAYRRAILTPVDIPVEAEFPRPDAAALFDWNAVIERACDGAGPMTGFLLRAGLKKHSPQSIVASTARNASGGDFRLLHVRT